jgi:hypothetical protein
MAKPINRKGKMKVRDSSTIAMVAIPENLYQPVGIQKATKAYNSNASKDAATQQSAKEERPINLAARVREVFAPGLDGLVQVKQRLGFHTLKRLSSHAAARTFARDEVCQAGPQGERRQLPIKIQAPLDTLNPHICVGQWIIPSLQRPSRGEMHRDT